MRRTIPASKGNRQRTRQQILEEDPFSDHSRQHYKVSFVGNAADSSGKIPTIEAHICSWNILNQCTPKDKKNPRKFLGNNPWSYKEKDSEYITRRKKQAALLAEGIAAGRNDIICLQEFFRKPVWDFRNNCYDLAKSKENREQDLKIFLDELRRNGHDYQAVTMNETDAPIGKNGVPEAKDSVTFYNANKFKCTGCKCTSFSPNPTQTGPQVTGMYLGLSTFFEADGVKFVVENIHGPFKNADLIARNYDALRRQTQNRPLISVGDFNTDYEELTEERHLHDMEHRSCVVGLSHATNFDAKQGPDARTEDAEMDTEGKCYDIAIVSSNSSWEFCIDHVSRYFDESLETKLGQVIIRTPAYDAAKAAADEVTTPRYQVSSAPKIHSKPLTSPLTRRSGPKGLEAIKIQDVSKNLPSTSLASLLDSSAKLFRQEVAERFGSEGDFDFSSSRTDPNLKKTITQETRGILQQAINESGIREKSAALVILLAIRHHGTKSDVFAKNLKEITGSDDLLKKARNFSALFQEGAQASEIFTGNQDATELVGMRLKRLSPEYALDLLRDTVSPDKEFEKMCKKVFPDLSRSQSGGRNSAFR